MNCNQPRRWAFTLQAAILADMHHQHAARTAHGNRHGWIFVERSPASSAFFARNSADLGHMDPREMRLLTSLQARLGWVADVTAYVDTGPATCLLRMQGRHMQHFGDLAVFCLLMNIFKILAVFDIFCMLLITSKISRTCDVRNM